MRSKLGGVLTVEYRSTKLFVSFLTACTSSIVLGGCRCDGDVQLDAQVEQKHDVTDLGEPDLLEPEDEPLDPKSRCRNDGSKPVIVRSTLAGAATPGSVEVSTGAFNASMIVATGVRSGDETHALVAIARAGETPREIDLGRLLGASEAPVSVIHGESIIVALQDSDAMGQQLRLYRIDLHAAGGDVVRGPELSIPRGGSGRLSLAITDKNVALLAWDQPDQAALRSRLMGVAFDASTLKELSPVQKLSADQEDAEEPVVTASSGGFVVSYLRLLAAPVQQSEDTLMVEPERSLFARRLDAHGIAQTDPLRVSNEGEHILAFDALATDEATLLAYRSTRAGHAVEENAVRLSRLSADGTLIQAVTEHSRLGPGAPLLLGDPGGAPWLFARGRDAENLMASIDNISAVELHVESQLMDQIPLARMGTRLLAMKPLGLDWSLQSYDCPSNGH